MIAPLLALLLATATPSPTASPSVPCGGRCVAGIAVGDDANAILARLDSRSIPGSDQHVTADLNSYPDELMLAVYDYRGAVVAVSISSAGSSAQMHVADPYGIRLGDTSDHLTVVRGAATTAKHVLRYGPTDGINWDYTVDAGIITTIVVSSVDQSQPGAPTGAQP